MPQPTSKPGQPGGNHGPTLPTNLPVLFSSTTNMPKPCSAQCPEMIAAFRHPTNASVMGLLSAVMKGPDAGSASIAVLGAISDACHVRSFRRPVSMTGPPGCVRLTPGLRGTTIAIQFLRLSAPGLPCQAAKSLKACRTDKTPAEPNESGNSLPPEPVKVHKGSHHHETPRCFKDNGDRRLGGRSGRHGGKGGDHSADICAGSRRLAWRLVLEPGRGPAARRRPPGVHANTDRIGRAQAFAVESHHAGYLRQRHRQCHRGRGIV